jgi:cytochrome P450
MSQPGPNFNEQRKVFRQALGPHVIGEYDALIQRHFDSFCDALSVLSGNPFPVIVECVVLRSEGRGYPLTLSI